MTTAPKYVILDESFICEVVETLVSGPALKILYHAPFRVADDASRLRPATRQDFADYGEDVPEDYIGS